MTTFKLTGTILVSVTYVSPDFQYWCLTGKGITFLLSWIPNEKEIEIQINVLAKQYVNDNEHMYLFVMRQLSII